MKGWKKTTVRGKSPARKKQRAHGDHSVGKVKRKAGPEAKKSSLGFAGNNIQGLGDKRPMPDNRGGSLKG